VGAGAVACGESGPSREEYAAQANRVCDQLIRSSEALGELRPDSVREVVQVIDRLERSVQQGVGRLRALERPEGDAGETAGAFVEAFAGEFRGSVLPALGAMRMAAEEGDVAGLRAAVARLRRVDNSRSEALARQLGATRCSS